jgi:hypothetical protein
MNPHAQLVDTAEDAIKALFADTSVPPETTRDDLKSLRETIDGLIEGVNADIATEGR